MHAVYKRMLQKMEENDGRRRKRSPHDPWSVYILECGDGTFYTGIAKEVTKRFQAHSKGRGAKYTRARLPLKLIYKEEGLTRTQALVRECAVKSLSRGKKEALIQNG